MANVTVSTNPSTNNNTLTVNFTTDATNITDVQLTKDGGNYTSATSFTGTSATFNVASWSNGIYDNCYLKVIYTASTGGGGTGGGDSGGGSTEAPIELVFRNGKINASNGAEEPDSVIGITDFIQYSTNKKLTCTANNCYLDIFIYDNNYTFEGKQGYNIGDSVNYTLLSTKKYRLEITPSDWVTQITTSNYKNFLVNFNIADAGGSTGGSTGGGSTTYTSAVSSDFIAVGNCSGISVDSSNNLVASISSPWGMIRLNKAASGLKFNVRGINNDSGALSWYIYKDNGDGTYDMIALGFTSEHGKRFKMTIPGNGIVAIDTLSIPTIDAGEQLTIEISGGTQTIKRADGSVLTTLTGNMCGWCGQSNASSPFCSNVQYKG